MGVSCTDYVTRYFLEDHTKNGKPFSKLRVIVCVCVNKAKNRIWANLPVDHSRYSCSKAYDIWMETARLQQIAAYTTNARTGLFMCSMRTVKLMYESMKVNA